MPRGTNPNSLKNLEKGHKITSSDDSLRKKAAEARQQKMTIAEAMKETMTPDKRRQLAERLVQNMSKSPQWYELGLKMLGEMPAEKLLIAEVDASAVAEVERMVLDD